MFFDRVGLLAFGYGREMRIGSGYEPWWKRVNLSWLPCFGQATMVLSDAFTEIVNIEGETDFKWNTAR